RAPDLARLHLDLDLDRRVAARIEDLPGLERGDLGGQRIVSLAASKYRSCSSSGSSEKTSPSPFASSSARSTLSAKRLAIDLNASSGSTFSRRATLTAAKRTSPTSSNTCGSGSASGAGSPADS